MVCKTTIRGFDSRSGLQNGLNTVRSTYARVVKLVDTQDLKFCGRKAVWVRFPPRAPRGYKLRLVAPNNLTIYRKVMPHVSKQALTSKTIEDLEHHLINLFEESSSKSRKDLMVELLTKTERLMLAKRIAILYMLNSGASIYKISHILKVSPSTIARFKNGVDSKNFAGTLRWLKVYGATQPFIRLVGDLLAIPFSAQRQSLKQYVKHNV